MMITLRAGAGGGRFRDSIRELRKAVMAFGVIPSKELIEEGCE